MKWGPWGPLAPPERRDRLDLRDCKDYRGSAVTLDRLARQARRDLPDRPAQRDPRDPLDRRVIPAPLVHKAPPGRKVQSDLRDLRVRRASRDQPASRACKGLRESAATRSSLSITR